MTAPLLDVVDLRKSYGPVTALAGVSFQVHQGEIFGLLGPNGAGKTSLLSILSSLSEASGGEVRLLGRRLHAGDRDVRRLIGIVPQELALYEQLTARENLQFFGELFGVYGKQRDDRVESLLRAVGLEGRAEHRVATFSGGMQRRLNLAAALVHEPRLLLLDEPTVGVDPQSRALIFEEVRRLNGGGMTVVYTSHYMEEVEALCSRIGIIDRGKLEACDTLANLVRMLRGVIRCQVSELPPGLRRRLADLPDCQVRYAAPESVSGIRLQPPGTGEETRGGLAAAAVGENEIDLECSDVKTTLIRLVGMLSEAQVDLIHLETQVPNLERVFLHLTGRALRD